MDATSPLRAHHRLMKEILSGSYGSLHATPTPEELDLVSRIFQRAGGKWSQVYLGSVKDINLLKKTLKIAAQKGYLTRASNWGE